MQINILDAIDAHNAKLAGMQQALDSANNMPPFDWSEQAYSYLKEWLRSLPQGYAFMTEDARKIAEESKAVPVPPSLRAWGGIISKLRNDGFIKSNGVGVVKNATAHQCFATIWIKL